jgi:hypothetical protein
MHEFFPGHLPDVFLFRCPENMPHVGQLVSRFDKTAVIADQRLDFAQLTAQLLIPGLIADYLRIRQRR